MLITFTRKLDTRYPAGISVSRCPPYPRAGLSGPDHGLGQTRYGGMNKCMILLLTSSRRSNKDYPFDRLSWFSNICLILIRNTSTEHVSFEHVITALCVPVSTCQSSRVTHMGSKEKERTEEGCPIRIEFNVIPPFLRFLLVLLHPHPMSWIIY